MNNITLKNNPSFTSNILFVSNRDFSKIFKKLEKKGYVDSPWTFRETKFSDKMLGTDGINTCSSNTIAQNGKALMMHLTSGFEENFYYIEEFAQFMKNLLKKHHLTSSLIIGSKSPKVPILDPEYATFLTKEQLYDNKSEVLFNKLKNILIDTNPTLFEGHSNPSTVSNYVYDVKNDTYYINTMLDIFNLKSYVKNWDDLYKAFDNIQISPRDSVNFIA